MSSAPAISKDLKTTGYGETVIREPLYVFAVSDFNSHMTDEVNDFFD
jgi:hypothetical protein